MRVVCVLMGMLLLSFDARAECPHERAGLLRWSNDATWGGDRKPVEGDNVEISQAILLDISPPSLSDITIQQGGSLIFDPEVQLELRVKNIFVGGTMEVGSEDCPYKGYLTITLTGNRGAHIDESDGKAILIKSGGTLELHGEPRLSWTKINKTLTKDSGEIYFEHKYKDEYTSFSKAGIIAYTVNVIGSEVTVKQFGHYNLKSKSDALAEHINNLENGDVLMMAGQKKIPIKTDGTQKETAYETIETLLYGEVTGTAVLRSVSPNGATWAFVYKKGSSWSYDEDTNKFGTTSTAQFVDSDLVFTVESIGNSSVTKQTVNFRVTDLNTIFQLVDVVDDVTTWHPGDRVMIASTDYDWKQAEEREIVFCPECSNYQIRIDAPVNFVHYGKVLHKAIDMRAEIALIDRKVVIRGEVDPTCPEINLNCDSNQIDNKDTFGGHIKAVYGFENVHIENIELYNMGQQTDLGRYPVHFHMCLGREPWQSQPYVKGCSIHDTFARCITVHGTHGVLVADNACINHMGHGYFLEDGGEMNNTFDGNLAISTRKGTGFLEPVDKTRPASFWFTNPNNYFRNNHAAGGEGTGIWVIFPDEPLPPSRQYNLMGFEEAIRTNLLEFTNNNAHSQARMGVMIGDKLEDNRNHECCNLWQPLVDPKNESSDPIDAYISYVTGYKNKEFNIWIEGGSVHVSQVSVADSENGIMVSNEGQQNKLSGTLSNAVIIGDSENVGVPADGFDRSIPRYIDEPHSGITLWKGPTRFSNIWFDGFTPNNFYDNGAIAHKRKSPYFLPLTTSFKDSLFAFDDVAGVGTYAISGTTADPGWEDSRDGELVSGFTWLRDTTNGLEKLYVVKPDAFSAAASDCRLRPHWRLAVSKTKYGNLRVRHGGFDENSRAIFVRDDYPGAQLEFLLEKKTGPEVVIDGSRTYTFHITGIVPDWMKFVAEGIETGDILRIGVCIPSGATWTIESVFPKYLKTIDDFVEVNSLADLDATDPVNDGKKYFYDSGTRMLYYKFVGYTIRPENETDECGGGKCPEFKVILSGDLSGNGDCRQTLYGSKLADLPPALETYTDTIPANGDKTPPAGFGAGETRPFSSRSPVNGGYGPWTEWSECSATCGVGVQYKTRECNNPLPGHGGNPCSGKHIRSHDCEIQSCDSE